MKDFMLEKQARKYHKYNRGEEGKQSNNMQKKSGPISLRGNFSY